MTIKTNKTSSRLWRRRYNNSIEWSGDGDDDATVSCSGSQVSRAGPNGGPDTDSSMRD